MKTTRTTSQKTQSTNRSNALGSYLAITAGVAAVSLPNADAAVIAYDGPALTVHPTDTDKYLYFSPLATAGSPTLGIRAGISSNATLNSFNIKYRALDYVYTVKPIDDLLSMAWGTTSASGNYVSLLKQNAGETIDATSNTWFADTWAHMSKDGWTTAQSPWATGQDGTTGFVPFKFALVSAETDIYYGWVNYTYNNNPSTRSLILNSFAYENTPNTAITTGTVPEPSSLLLLALGGAGVAVARRLRKEKKAANAPVA